MTYYIDAYIDKDPEWSWTGDAEWQCECLLEALARFEEVCADPKWGAAELIDSEPGTPVLKRFVRSEPPCTQ